MTIALRANGGTGIGSTTVTPGLPAGMQDGDGCLVWVITKPDTATINVPAGWTAVVDVAGGGGTTGASAGPTRQAVLFREKDASWSTMPAVSVTSGNATVGRSVAFSKDAAATWALAGATGTYGSAAATTDGTVTHGSNPGIAAGDWCAVSYASMDDAPTISNPGTTGVSLAATGVTFGTIGGNWLGVFGTTTGNDVGGAYYLVPVSSGTATAAPVTAVTWSAVTRGTAAVVRLREDAGGASLTGSPADAVGVTDAPATVLDGARSPIDSVGITDAAGTALAAVRSQGDPVGVTDAAASALAAARAPADPEAITDATATTLAADRTQPDAVGITDSASAVLTSGATRTQPDAVGLTDAVTAQLDRVVTVDDLLGLIDAPAPTIIRPRPSDDTVETTDALTVTLERVVDVADTVGILDAVTPGDGGPPPTPQRRIVSAVLTIPTLAADLEVPGSIAATITARAVRADLTIPEARGVLT